MMDMPRLGKLLGIDEFDDYIRLVRDELNEILAASNDQMKPALMRVAANGKRLRPALVIASALCAKSDITKEVFKTAAAIELLHIASLVHDDIIDEADTRRGVRTINADEGTFTAILAGDYLLAKAFETAASVDQNIASDLSATFAAMCDGQNQELADRHNITRTASSYLEVIRNKTARLISLSCRSGGICAGLPLDQIGALSEFGECFGMAFQLIDDLLDLEPGSKTIGKPAQNDIREGVYTMPVLLCLQSREAEAMKNILKKKILNPADNREIIRLLKKTGSIDKTIEIAQYYNLRASNSLKVLGQTNAVQTMAKLPSTYLELALQNQQAKPLQVL